MNSPQSIVRLVLVILFVAGGVNHFIMPEFYLRMMPSYLPQPLALIQLSGVAEVIFGVALMFPHYRGLVRFSLVALLIAVFPANIQMALHPEDFPEFREVLLWARLPLQVVLIALVVWSTGKEKNSTVASTCQE